MPVTKMPDFTARQRALIAEGTAAVRDSLAIVEKEINARYRAGTGPASLARRTGQLASSPRREMRSNGREISGRVYIPSAGGRTIPVHAGVHEFGATITPKRGRYLAIPLPSLRGRTAAGKISMGPRDFPGGFFFRSRSGNLIYAIREGRGRMRPLFVLKERVVIPARPIWGTTRQITRPLILQRFELANRRVANAGRVAA